MDAKAETLRAAIFEARDCGDVTFALEARPDFSTDLATSLDEFVAKFQFVGLGESWREIDSAAAVEIAVEILFRDLAHGVKMTTQEHAFALAKQFLNHFDEEPRFFTNGVFKNGGLSSWTAISNATFDTGIIVLDVKSIGILWVQDED